MYCCELVVQGAHVNWLNHLQNKWAEVLVVYRLKSVGALEFEFVAPIPEQIATTTVYFSKVLAGSYYKFSLQKLGEVDPFLDFQYRVQTDWSAIRVKPSLYSIIYSVSIGWNMVLKK